MFGRLILAVAWLAALLFVANAALALSGLQGLGIQRLHLMGGFVSTALMIFAHVWLAVYFTGLVRLFRDEGLQEGIARLRNGQRMAILVSLLAIANFVIAVLRLAGGVGTWAHDLLVWSCLVAQIVGLVLETKAVRVAVDGIAALRGRSAAKESA